MQRSEARGCRDGAALPGHAEIPSCSIPHPCFPGVTKDVIISALSIKADNQLLSKISTERKPNPRAHPLLQRLRETGEHRPGLHFPYTTCTPWNSGCRGHRAAPAETLRVMARRQSPGAAPQDAQVLSERDPSQHGSARHRLEHTHGHISHQLQRRDGNLIVCCNRARLSHHGNYVDTVLPGAGTKGGDKGRQRQVGLIPVTPFCRTAYVTTGSDLGNKDMISSGANFLGALKNVAGKI